MQAYELDTSADASFYQSQSGREQHLGEDRHPSQLDCSTIGKQLGGPPNLDAHAGLLNRVVAAQPARAGQLARQLQRQYGNRYVAQVAAQARQPCLVVQPKLAVTPAADQYEQEADRVAAQVVREIAAPARRPNDERAPQSVQRTPDLVQRQTAEPLGGTPIEPQLEASIQAARGGGQALPNPLRGRLEQSFGADFGGVTIHTGTEADRLNQSLQARAFTTGQDIFFRQGEYAPGSAEGQRLLAHELTHVVQQGNGVIHPERLASQSMRQHYSRIPINHAMRQESTIVQTKLLLNASFTDKQQFRAALTFVAENLSRKMGSFYQYLAKSENTDLEFTAAADTPNDFGETKLLVLNPDGTWGDMDGNINVNWQAINQNSHFKIVISFNNKHNWRSVSINIQTMTHELTVHAIFYQSFIQEVRSGLRGIPKRWEDVTARGRTNNGRYQHYQYGQGLNREYNTTIDRIVGSLNESGYVRHARQLAGESARDITEHALSYPNY